MMKMQIPTMAQRHTTAPSAFSMSSFGHLAGTGFGDAFGTTTPATTGAFIQGIALTQVTTGDVRLKAMGGVRPETTNVVLGAYAHSGTSAWRPPLS